MILIEKGTNSSNSSATDYFILSNFSLVPSGVEHYYTAEVKSYTDYYAFGSTMPNRSYASSDYKFGFSGYEKDDEIKGSGNHYSFSDYGYDPRINRRWRPDPKEASFPFVTPYAYSNNNPILYIDPDGREWVNAHTAQVEKLNKQLLDNPNDKKLQRQLNRAQQNEARVNQYLSDLKTNDAALYNYIDQLKVSDQNGNERNVKVYVSFEPNIISGNNGQTAETRYSLTGTEPNVSYGDKDIVAPKGENGVPSFDVKVYGKTSFGDERLSNEAGDVMYFMEYNKDAVEEGSNSQFFEQGGGGQDAYLNSGSGSYSNKVQYTYRQRKKDVTGSDPNNNPYPLKKDEK